MLPVARGAAFRGEPLVIEGATWTARLPASAVIRGPEPPPAGKRGRPRKKGGRTGKCKDAAVIADWRDMTVRIYGREQKVQAAAFPGLWYGSFGDAPGKQVTGAGGTCSRVPEAVERSVPFAFLVQSLMICRYAISCDPAAGIEQRRQRSPWYTAKATPAAAGMHAALTQARINAIIPGSGTSQKTSSTMMTSETRTA